MLQAVKGNKVLIINDDEMAQFQEDGFDVVEIMPDGNERVILYGHGKTVPYGKYMEAVAQIEALTAKVDALVQAQAKAKAAKKK